MDILSFKPGHDGCVALVEDGEIAFALEAEKDSFPRYSPATPSLLIEALSRMRRVPDVVCLSGWVKGLHPVPRDLGAGYIGWDESSIQVGAKELLGHTVRTFTSTHERSHLLSAYGLSPFPQGAPCYALVWEGTVGSFYEITPDLQVICAGQLMKDPGNKYQYIFALADPAVHPDETAFRFENAGKLMALAAYAQDLPATEDERRLIDFILDHDSILMTRKADVKWSPFYNIGVESREFKNLAARLSQAMFERFRAFAAAKLTKGYPLLIAGGCGLNCSWNFAWRTSELFTEVFVPPCTNDTGSAIGTAVDAQRHFTGEAKVAWSVYAGSDFTDAATPSDSFTVSPLNVEEVARMLRDGYVLGWVQGRYEMGPRALGNRSIIAAPFLASTRDRLNTIKEREDYRPISPVCLEEDVNEHFMWSGESAHMLYAVPVRSKRLAAVTHVDGSARIQTVRRDQNERLHELLRMFKNVSGVGVLCNTSLNFKGRGFINQTSDLMEYAVTRGLDGFIVHDRLYVNRRSPLALANQSPS